MAMSISESDQDELQLSDEQARYASWLSWSARSGLVMLIIAFAAYVTGLLPAHVALDHLPAVWGLPTAEYLKQTNTATGWSWLTMIGQGDFAGLVGIAWLAGSSLLCLIVVLPIYVRKKDWVYVALCIGALAVQLLAASGVFTK